MNRNLNREKESHLTATQDNVKSTNYVKVKTDKTKQNNECRLCGEKVETIIYIINEWRKLAQKEDNIIHD